MPLLPPDLCVVCFHKEHPDTICQELDGFTFEMTGKWMPCGCTESVNEEQREK